MRRNRTVACAVAATALAAVLAGAAGPARVDAAGLPGGEVGLTYSFGEVSTDEEGEYAILPSSSLGLEFTRRTGPFHGDGPELKWEGYLTAGASPATKAGATLGLDWEPVEGPWSGRRYSLSASLAERWSGEAGRAPEQAWEADGAIHERNLGAAALEVGGRAGTWLHRLSGRDYRELAGYLSTRFVVTGEPGVSAWMDPAWLRGFSSLFTPPPEPGADQRTDLPFWYEAADLPGLPSLPPAGADEGGTDPTPPRLVVTARHTQSLRRYAGDPSDDWEAGETRLEVREQRLWGELATSYASTLKFYPADSARTYQLAEGELEVNGPVGEGRGRAAAGFRNRFPWEGGAEAYRQTRFDLGYSLPGPTFDWRFGGEWRCRRYESGPGQDYTVTTVETGVSQPAAGGERGLTVSAAVAAGEKRYLSGAKPLERSIRLRLRGELPVAPGQTVSAGFAWERTSFLPSDGSQVPGSSEALARLAWTRSF